MREKFVLPLVLGIFIVGCGEKSIAPTQVANHTEDVTAPRQFDVRPMPVGTATLQGCSADSPGMLGLGTASGQVGQVVSVPVTVWASDYCQSVFTHIQYPEELVEWVETVPGELPEGAWFFDSSHHPNLPIVSILTDEYPFLMEPDQQGELATLRFRIIEEGRANIRALFVSSPGVQEVCGQ